MSVTVDELAAAMQRWGFLETPAPDAALRWIATFLEAYGENVAAVDDAFALVEALRAEACTIPALELERLRSRDAVFFIDAVGQYVDDQPELRDLPLARRPAGDRCGIRHRPRRCARRGAHGADRKAEGPPLELLFPLLGHDRILIRAGAVSSKLLHGRGLEPIAFGPDGAPFEPLRGQRPSRAR